MAQVLVRDLENELQIILQEAATEPIPKPHLSIAEIQAMFEGEFFSDSAELLREDRDR